MSNLRWQITLIIARQKGDRQRCFQEFNLEVDPEEAVLDVIERVWVFHDRSLVFRHACHHSTCGACGMLVNGVEKLTCITPIHAVTHHQGSLKIEPLRNFPVISDLVVDMSAFYARMEAIKASPVVPLSRSTLPYEKAVFPADDASYERLADCIECGMCLSACPVSLTSTAYLGPAVLAAANAEFAITADTTLLQAMDCAAGVWRCHSGFECSAVCPSHVDPAWRIMHLRRQVIANRLKSLFHRPQKVSK